MSAMIANAETTTEQDRDEGWTDSDWMNHTRLVDPRDQSRVGYVENWRFQLSRKLEPWEGRLFSLRSEETYSALEGMSAVDKTLEILKSIAGPSLHLKRIRIGSVEGVVTDRWSYEMPALTLIDREADADG